MSVVTRYVRLSRAELAELRRRLTEEPDGACGYADDLGEESPSRGLDTDKAWGGLRHLLSRAGAPVDVIGGGRPVTDEEWGYDAPRLLTAAEVHAAAGFLGRTPFAALSAHFEPAALTTAEVYPADLWTQDWALSYLEEHYDGLVTLFRGAAADHEPILVWQS
jgi:hypothetical protein